MWRNSFSNFSLTIFDHLEFIETNFITVGLTKALSVYFMTFLHLASKRVARANQNCGTDKIKLPYNDRKLLKKKSL